MIVRMKLKMKLLGAILTELMNKIHSYSYSLPFNLETINEIGDATLLIQNTQTLSLSRFLYIQSNNNYSLLKPLKAPDCHMKME